MHFVKKILHLKNCLFPMIYTPQNVEEHRKCEDQSGLQNLRPLFDPHLPSQTHMEASRLERRELPRSLRISPALFITESPTSQLTIHLPAHKL